MLLKDKIVWVPGGAGYLGRAILSELESSGAIPVCLDLAGRGEAAVAELQLKRTRVETFDFSQRDIIESRCAELVQRHGPPAGAVILALRSSAGKSFNEIDGNEFAQTLDVSVTANFLFARAAANAMCDNDGAIVFFSSMYGLVAPRAELYHPPMTVNPVDYGAAKAAVIQMTRYLAMQYGPRGIRVNCIAPGPFPNPHLANKTPPGFVERLSQQTLLGRVGTAPEIAGPVRFLLSNESSFVTGQCLTVDGGWTVR